MTEGIEDMLVQNKTLEELNISACRLSSKTIAALIPGLGRNTALKAYVSILYPFTYKQ
jgi:hypothetical protein